MPTKLKFKSHWLGRYAFALVAVAAAFWLREGLTRLAGGSLPTYITFYPAVMLSALLGGVGPGLLATVLAALGVDYFILPPIGAFTIAALPDAVGLAFFTGMGVFMSVVAELYRRARQKAAAQDSEVLLREGGEAAPRWSRQGVLLNAGLAAALAVLGVAGWQCARTLRATAKADKRVTHTYVVIEELDRLLSALKDAETGQRGYLLTGEEKYLEPYQAALGQVQTNLAELKQLTRDNAGQQQPLASIEALIREKLAELQRTIELRRTQGLPAALQVVTTDKGRTLMDNIRKRVAEARNEEARLLQWQTAAESADAGQTMQALLASGVLSFLLLITVFLFLKQENARRTIAEAEVRHHRDHLQEIVAARTAELSRTNDQLKEKIKEHQRAESALRQSEERYRNLVELSPEAVFVNRNDRLVLVNSAAVELFGASSAEQLLGKSPFEFFHPDYHAVIRERIGKMLAGQRTPFLEEKIVRLDGVTVDVEVWGAPVTDQGERAVQVLLRDITERKRAEAALQQTAEDLKRSNRDLEQFAYVASHDLQEPLRAVGGYVKLLQLRFAAQLDGKAQHYIDGAFEGATRMERLIADLLAFSRVGTRGGAFVPTELDAVLNHALHNLQAGIESAQATITRDPLPTLSVDATQITRLWQNLIGNALKFHDEQPPKIHIGARREEGRWVFSVRDNGIGIEPQYYEKIFLIFQRLHTRKDYSGTGIGLAICKKIVERHGGTIWVESQPGQGSTFYFSIPEAASGG